MKPSEMTEILERISAFVGSSPDDLAVTVAARGNDPFAVLVSTILSLRTRDEVVQIVTPRTLGVASTPTIMAGLTHAEIEKLIYPTSFYRMKSRHLKKMSQTIVEKFDGKVPDTMKGLLTLLGVGRKSANLVLSLGFKKPALCVDTHVHRISNRLGFVQASTPEKTELALMQVLPEEWWNPINGVLIAFGRGHCTPVSPKCSTCPVNGPCGRVGVGQQR